MKTSYKALLLAGGLMTGASAQAAIQTQSFDVMLPEFFETAFFESDGGGGEFYSIVVQGLPKFDPALGTLVDVTIDADLTMDLDFVIEAQGILNPGVPHDAGLTFSQIAFGIVYENNVQEPPVFNLLGDVITDYGLFCMGFPGDGDACLDFDFLPLQFGFQDVSMLTRIQLDDFVGTGDYTGLFLELDLIGPFFTLNNVDFAYAEVNAFMDANSSSVSITYHYDDGIGGTDTDGDGIDDSVDNCIATANASQLDADGDGFGNACDADINNDCIVNAIDLGALKAGFFGTNANLDFNGDGQVNAIDLGIMKINFFGVPGPSGTASCSN